MKFLKMIKKAAALLTVLAAVTGALSVTVSAAPDEGYTYDAWDNEAAAPVGYTADAIIDGTSLNTGKFNKPSDIFVDRAGTLYISDTGNNRLIITSGDYTKATVIDEITADGKKGPLEAPGGIFVNGTGEIFVAQKEKHRVLRMNNSGIVTHCYERPESPLLDETFEFLPTKVIESNNGTVFVLSEGYFYGALTFDNNGEFVGFYGCNKVDVTLQVLADYAWKRFLSKEQKSKMTRYVPVAYSSFDIDSDNFIYTCTQTTKNSKNELRKLNTAGNDVIKLYKKNVSATSGDYGDLKRSFIMGKSTDTQFVDVCVSAGGIINGLDLSRGRIFQYNTDGRLLNIFGGSGTKAGLFRTAAAIDDRGEDFLVLDSEKGSVTVFTPTDYTRLLLKAVKLYNNGLYSEAMPLWESLIQIDSGCETAYTGLGKALYAKGDYRAAMKAAERGYDREGYSLAFKAQREKDIRKAFPIVATVLIIALSAVLIYVFVRCVILKKPPVHKEKKLTPIRRIGRCMTHPLDEFYDIKDTKSWSTPAALVILALWFAVTVLSKTMTGFIFNYNRAENTNILMYFASTCVMFALFVVINWSVTTLTDGKGSMYQIFISCAYALIPYVVSIAACTVLSNIFTADEAAFYGFVSTVGILWSVFLMVGALRAIHDFTFLKTFVCIILTVLGMIFVIFLAVLFVSLVQQLISFAVSVFNELLYRS